MTLAIQIDVGTIVEKQNHVIDQLHSRYVTIRMQTVGNTPAIRCFECAFKTALGRQLNGKG